MFRQLQESYDRYSRKRRQQQQQDLPIGSFRRPPTSTLGTITSSITSSFRFNSNNNTNNNISFRSTRTIASMDGSASSIHTPWMVQKTWQRTQKPVRITYICLLIGIFMIWYGIRFLSYYNGSINITCHSIACDIILYPIGFQRKIQLLNVPRQQIVHVQAVKTYQNGTYITDQDIQLQDTSSNPRKQKYSKHKVPYSKSASYKGPDSNGYYTSYAFVLQDKNLNDERHIGMIDADTPDQNDNNLSTIPEVELTPILPYLQKLDNDDNSSIPSKYRLIPKNFGVRHSQRRIRSMISKIETYIKFRRQKLVITESASPAWQGIILIVFGSVTVLITCTLGQFTNENTHQQQYRGPGMRNSSINGSSSSQRRREQLLQKHNPSPSTTIAKRKITLQSINQIATPTQYEVNTTTATKNNTVTTTTSNSSRPPTTTSYTTTKMTANPNISYRKAVVSAHARSHVS